MAQSRAVRTAGRTFAILVMVGLAVGVWQSVTKSQTHSDPEQPPTRSASDLEEEREFPEAGMRLSPPTESDEPRISSERAAELAWNERVPGEPTSADARFAILSGAKFDRTPVWMITYTGVCIPAYGPLDGTEDRGCAGSIWNVILDAETGDLIVAISG